MGLLGNIIGGTAKDVITGIGNVADKVISNPEERLKAKAELSNVVMSNLARMQEAQSTVINQEAKGGRLQRNWRPLLMLCFGFILLYSYFIEPVLSFWLPVPGYEIPDQLFQLLKLGIGGYIGGRTVEKVAETVTGGGNVLNIFKRKKRQKETDK